MSDTWGCKVFVREAAPQDAPDRESLDRCDRCRVPVTDSPRELGMGNPGVICVACYGSPGDWRGGSGLYGMDQKRSRINEREFSERMRRAMRDTIEAYDQLIETGDWSWWEVHYGPYCGLCKASKAVEEEFRPSRDCTRCPCGPESHGCTEGELEGSRRGMLKGVSVPPSGRGRAAEERRDALVERFDRECPGWREEG